jgi:hypothetical protein
MNAHLTDKLTQAKAVQQVLNNNFSIVQTIPAFVKAKTDFDTVITSIDGLLQQQVKQTTGIAADKSAAETTAIHTAIELTGLAKAFAAETKSLTLKQAVNYNLTGLMRLRDAVLVNTLTSIHDTLQTEVANLADYGITADTLNNFAADIEAYKSLLVAPKTNINQHTANTIEIVTLFEQLDTIEERLDGFVNSKERTETSFYNTYQSAVNIIQTHGHSSGDIPPAPTPADIKTDK